MDCTKFKTGKFENIENGVVKSTIERTESIQKESFGDKEIRLEITWIGPCTYRLKLVYGNDAFWNGRPKNMPTPDLIVTITSVDANQYTQQAKAEGESFVYNSTMRKVGE